ncbi:MAG: CTP synthase [Candidatus Yonathbacteria bacterium]|nr:CTP synthase [Candidatus Yonathbacteria bacterium]
MAIALKNSKEHLKKNPPSYVFVVGGVISGVGKGITASSIAKIIQSRGFTVTAMKIDPYVNVDAGTMNPTEHGEVFVLDDGYETDQDLGNYERFLNITIPSDNYMTTGRVYQAVIERERNLGYKGQCVQVVPHIPLEVVRRIKKAGKEASADVVVIEIGGTVGEYENILFLEAVRMLKSEHPDKVAVVMVSYLPTPPKVGEMKTKPTQHASRLLNSAGLQADVIIARSEHPLDKKRKDKIAMFCNIRPEHVISAPDADSIYDIPVNFEKDDLGDIMLKLLSLPPRERDMAHWRRYAARTKSVTDSVKVVVVGKYFDTGDFVLSDAYISVIEAIKHAAYHLGKKPELTWVSAERFENPKALAMLGNYDGIIVPGGFGERGIEGKLNVIRYAREKKIPYFGLCYGMQLLVIEYARNVAGLKGANTAEIDAKAPHVVIDIMEDQRKKLERGDYGGSMRLGAYPAVLKKGTIARDAYKKEDIRERHRHRYEVNPEYIGKLESAGLVFSGTSPDHHLMEIAELSRDKHPFFLGTQFHPEFLSRPLHPHPLFVAFVKAASGKKHKKTKKKKRS